MKSQFVTSKEKGVVNMEAKEKKEVTIQDNEQIVDVEITENTIKNLIYVVRGQQVMLDSDLAILYQVETKRVNEAVKRNKKRFPETFCFQLTEEEFINLKSQFATSSLESDNGHGGKRKLPYVFTEQGIAMLSAILRSDAAVQVSIKIMNTFVQMRRFLANNSLMFSRINKIEVKQLAYQKSTDEKFDKVFAYISEHEEVSQKIFFEGQIYDAFSLLAQLVSKAEKKIMLIDNYVDVGTLNILAKKKPNVDVIMYTLKKTKLSQADVDRFNKQYPTLKVYHTKRFHDRFLIVDDIYAYHIGASVKDAGRKCFGINKIEDQEIVKDILERLRLETEEGVIYER